MLNALETTGTLSAKDTLQLDEDLPFDEPKKVRVIVLFDETDDFGEKEWLKSASNNEAFEFLKDESEDIYTLDDGKPLSQ